MKNLPFVYGGLDLLFTILDDGRVRLAHYGRQKHLIDCTTSLKSANFVQIMASGFDRNGHNGVKHNNSYFGENATYISHRFQDKPQGRELTILTQDGYFEAATHFLIYSAGESISVYNEVKNISNDPQYLEAVSSAYLYGFDEGENAKDIRLAYANNGWHVEAQWNDFSFAELGIFADNAATGPKRWHLNNVGSWSTKEYLPMAAITKKNNALLIQVEANGSWDLEVGGEGERRYLFSSGPNLTDSSWTKELKPQESFIGTSSTIAFGDDFEGALAGLTKARRLMRKKQEDEDTLPVIFNSYMHALWDFQTEDTLKPLIDSAALAGAEVFCIDAGWFFKNGNWWDSIGDWEEAEGNFPHGGLAATLDYIRQKGLKAGIWIEIENVGEGSALWEKAPKSWFLSVHGRPVFVHERHCLNFANPEVYAWAIKTVDRLMNLYHLDYLKCDYNVDAGIGSDYEADSFGDGLLKHDRALLRFFDEVESKYPHLTIENCASGGGRMDYETLKRFPIQSTSDQTDYRKYPYIAGNVLTACPPDQAAVWSYPVDSFRKLSDITDEDVAMNMVNALLGRIHLASFIDKLTPSHFSLVQEGVKDYKDTRELKSRAWPIYPKGLAHFDDASVAAGIRDDKTMILAIWNTSGKPLQISVDLQKYGIEKIDVLYPTSLKTVYQYDQKSGKLNIQASTGYMGRVFIAKLF